jgi:hypothetical protein
MAVKKVLPVPAVTDEEWNRRCEARRAEVLKAADVAAGVALSERHVDDSADRALLRHSGT